MADGSRMRELRTPRPQQLEVLARALGVAPDTLADYGVETSRNALEVLFRLEEGFGARPEAEMRARRDSGEISEEEYLDWKRGFAGR